MLFSKMESNAVPALLLLVLLLIGSAAPVAQSAGATDTQLTSAQGQLRDLLAQLDEIEELHDTRDSRTLMNRHWQAVQDYLHRLQDLVPVPAAGPQSLGPYGSAGSCRLAASMNPDRYVPAMRDTLWELREKLAGIHQEIPVERARSLATATRLAYQRLHAIRGVGWMYGSAAPVAQGNPPVPDSASEEAYLLRRYCGQCHAPPPPQLHSANEWHAVASKMLAHMSIADTDNPQEIERPTPRETTLILTYLEANGCEQMQ